MIRLDRFAKWYQYTLILRQQQNRWNFSDELSKKISFQEFKFLQQQNARCFFLPISVLYSRIKLNYLYSIYIAMSQEWKSKKKKSSLIIGSRQIIWKDALILKINKLHLLLVWYTPLPSPSTHITHTHYNTHLYFTILVGIKETMNNRFIYIEDLIWSRQEVKRKTENKKNK